MLHPTSLPSRYGIGDLGQEAYDFVDFLVRSGQKYWQILPLNPPGYGESPYSSFSAFAGNPLLISIDRLVGDGLLQKQDIDGLAFDEDKVQFNEVRAYKQELYRKAYQRFKILDNSREIRDFIEKNRYWLDDYSFYSALKDHFGGISWNKWERTIAFREKKAVEHYRQLLADEIKYHKFLQYIFWKQWQNLKRYVDDKGIKIIGDIPIFVAHDSSDTWINPHLFELDEFGNPTKVSGVPPDYFSATGQLWGNPHYKWDEMAKDDYSWWRARIKNLLNYVDIVRIDHFRGFEAYWEVPAGEKTAVNGRWVKASGDKLFASILRHLSRVPFIAEDLGVITPEVVQLKKKYGFPGMKIFQYSFDDELPEEERPEGYPENCVAYTGTHDNDTVLGWYKRMTDSGEKDILERVEKYCGVTQNMSFEQICWGLIEGVYSTRAKIVIIPLQDALCLDNRARMNTPATVGGNWEWRFRKDMLTPDVEEKLWKLVKKYHR